MAPFKSLTKLERKHLKESADVKTLTGFKVIAARQAEMRLTGGEPCHECKAIAVKLGLPV